MPQVPQNTTEVADRIIPMETQLHNIKPSEEHSRGGKSVKVYN